MKILDAISATSQSIPSISLSPVTALQSTLKKEIVNILILIKSSKSDLELSNDVSLYYLILRSKYYFFFKFSFKSLNLTLLLL